jgi:hypothetical protein
MAATPWQLTGQYMETCSCDYVCPCLPSHLEAKPTKGSCTFAMAFHIDRGRYGSESLDGLTFVIIGRTPEEMIKGNWDVGVIVDERASSDQRQAIAAVCSGQAGGPMAALAPLVGTFHGVEAKPIRFEGSDLNWSVSAPGVLDEAAQGVTGMGDPPMPLAFDNTGHPAADRFYLAKAVRSHLHLFGIDWDDDSGRNNGQYAPFNWQGG